MEDEEGQKLHIPNLTWAPRAQMKEKKYNFTSYLKGSNI